MKFIAPKKEKKGFALLFSVLLSSLLLTIGLSIFSIALKELAISTASKQSVHAFYAADSGREYALYHDTKLGDASPSFNIDIHVLAPPPPDSFSGIVDAINDPNGPNYTVQVQKSWADSSWTKINTSITSTGHDSTSGDRVERAINQTY